MALAGEILAKYAELTTGPRIAFFEALANRFGPDHERLDAAIADWQAEPSDTTAAEVHTPPSRAGRSCCAGSISRPAAPPRWCACASS